MSLDLSVSSNAKPRRILGRILPHPTEWHGGVITRIDLSVRKGGITNTASRASNVATLERNSRDHGHSDFIEGYPQEDLNHCLNGPG